METEDSMLSVTTRTGWSDHALPLLKQRCLKAVAWAEAVGLVSRHQLLHWLQYHAQLQPTQHQRQSHLTQI